MFVNLKTFEAKHKKDNQIKLSMTQRTLQGRTKRRSKNVSKEFDIEVAEQDATLI